MSFRYRMQLPQFFILFALFASLILSGSSVEAAKKQKQPGSLQIMHRFVKWGYQVSSARLIDTLIIHSSYSILQKNPYSASGVLKEYRRYGVASHYLITHKGTVLQLVRDNNIAFHVGIGKMPDGREDINNFSIGIELINTETTGPTETQYTALVNLVQSLKRRYPIKYILGHNQVSPGLKTDPWNFSWEKFNAKLASAVQ